MTAESNRDVRPPDAADAEVDADRQRAWLEVDLGALRRNAELVRRRAGVPLIPMVKADAYGLGAVRAARALEPVDPWAFGVATVAEGEQLRAAQVDRRIVLFSPILPSELARASHAGLTPSLHRAGDVAAWRALGGGAWHLAIDTGMSRAGVRWDELDAVRDAIAAFPPEGVYTHFHSADAGDDSYDVQLRRFDEALAQLPARPAIVHAENSPALERHAPSRWTVARPGVFLYGVGSESGVEPEPVAHLRARVVDLRTVRAGESVSYGATWRADRDRTIATVGAGYADGYRRSLGNRGIALLHGHEVPVAGWVTMDMTMLDVTDLPDVPCAVGDVATLLGTDRGRTVTAEALGRAAGLSPYEILAGLRLRVPRLYLEGPG